MLGTEEVSDQLASASASQRSGSLPNSRGDVFLNPADKPEEYLELHDVRIIPSKMIFRDAYDGKTFSQSFTIINAGKYPALVRVFPPTSKAFRMKPLPRGRYLASGMSITRKMFFTYVSAMAVPQACLSIYINDDLLLYEIEVFISMAFISLKPKLLDFGEIDVGTASEQMGVQLSNCGHKGAMFVVDLGRNDLELIVHPMKGLIKPSETLEVKVEILGTKEGTFLKEFWIKTEPPQRVWITGTFIRPCLVIEHPISIFDMALLDFPKTYYGAKSTRTLVIQNKSSTATMFCTLAEHLRESVFLRAAKKTDDNLKSFVITSREGRLLANHKYILGVSFIPKLIKNIKQSYCMAFIRILKVNYRDGIIDDKDIEVKTFTSSMDLEQYSIASLHDVEDVDTEQLERSEEYLRVCLYGEIEVAAVELKPDAIDIAHLLDGESCVRTFNVRNKSRSLPITFKYNKIACIELDPDELTLNPGGNIDVSLVIRPTKIGMVEHKLILELLYRSGDELYEVGRAFLALRYVTVSNPGITRSMVKPKFNMGITPANTNEVGFLVGDTKYNSKIKKPIQSIVDANFDRFNKYNADLIAFPNDRARSLRPWRCNVPCTTIFAKIPRYAEATDEYTLSKLETERKKYKNAYYSNYLRAAHKDLRTKQLPDEVLQDYDTPEKCLLLMNNKWIYRDCPKVDVKTESPSLFIPMPPEELMNIQIGPRYIQLGKIAPFTSCSDYFAIKNKNEFPVNISIRALSNSVVIKGKRRKTIVAHNTENIYFDCYSHGLGKYYVPVYIIVNDCHIFDATVFAEVVPTTLKSFQREVTICPRGHAAFFEMYNPVNCEITFNWEIQDSNYKISPESGKVPPRRNLYCKVMFNPQVDAVYTTEIYLISQSGAKEIIRVINENKKAEVAFHTQNLDFGHISLNTLVTKNLILRNFSEESIVFSLSNPNPLEEVTVFPSEGTLPARSDILFRVSVHFKAAVDFDCTLTFTVQDEYVHYIKVTGNVCYPDISIEPNSIQIRKIETGALQRRVIRVTNVGPTKNFISFPFQTYPEFSVTDVDRNILDTEIVLEPDESKDIFLDFKPQEPTAYSFLLPYILNGLLGPAVLNERTSLDPRSYFNNVEGFEVTDQCPKSMSVVKVKCAAGAAWFKFSSLHLKFTHRQGGCHNHFDITNVSTTAHILYLSLAEVKLPFSVNIEESDMIRQKRKKYHEVELSPGDTISWLFEYDPTDFGEIDVYLPIAVGDISKNGVYNFLRLSGSYPEPKIISEMKVLYLQTIPANEHFSRKICFKFSNHKEDCTIMTETGDENLNLMVEEKTVLTENEYELSMCLSFNPQDECTVSSKIMVSCTCEAAQEVEVKCAASNCRLLSYGFHLGDKVQEKDESFPYFPNDPNNRGYLEGMEAIVEIIEKFLYNQGFFYTDFFKIPDTISTYPFEMYEVKAKPKNKMEKSKKETLNLPLVQLLIDLLNDSIVNEITDGKSKPSLDDVKGTIYDYGVYKNVMKFLDVYDIFIQQMRPELLLTYERYVVFKTALTDKDNSIGEAEPLLSEEKFYLFSKQCWVDLLIGIYKVFVFDRTLGKTVPSDSPRHKEVIYEKEISEYFENNIPLFQNCNENETKLMLWLEFHFNNQRTLLWPEGNVQHRIIRSFEDDVKDSIPFVTLMAAYCPYISDSLKDAYDNPTTTSLLFHNACIASESWNKLRLSYTVKPEEIFEPIGIGIMMFLTYLYEVLPNFYPSETISINSPLGESASNEIELKNSGDVPIAYSVTLFKNDSEEFEVSSDSISIPPKKSKKLKVSYTAKSFLETKAVLVLSGETIGFRFAKSKAVNLTGIPDIFHITEEYNIKIDMYQPTTHQLAINSPYAKSYVADVYFYIKSEDGSESNNDFIPIKYAIENKVPRQICMEESCEFDDEGAHVCTLKLCFVACGLYERYVYFLNKEVGVFCIKLSINSKLSEKTKDKLFVNFSTNLCDTCKCKTGVINYLCPRIINFEISCRNYHLLEGLRNMIELYADENEFKFWDEHLVFPKGFRILGSYLENTFDARLISFKNIMNPTVSYDTVVKGGRFSIAKSILIEDVTCSSGKKIPIHWDAEDCPRTETLILMAANGQETRRYQLNFRQN